MILGKDRKIFINRLRAVVHARWFPFLILLLISALVYLPKITQLTYYRDDWYYMYDGLIAGPSIFDEMFKSDRPARGLFFGFYFTLFGVNPFPYTIGAYLWRLASGVGAFWLFNLIWPLQKNRNLFAALLVLVYPGYRWWVAGIEYQPMIASFCFQILSIALTLKAVTSEGKRPVIVYSILAIVTGWYYILLVDYAIGMEVFRFLCVYILLSRPGPASSIERFRNTLKSYWIYLVIPLGYLIWRIFIFQNERNATDVGLQVGDLISSPLAGLWGIVRWMQSFLNVALMAWLEPFGRHFYTLRLREMLVGILIGALVVSIILVARILLSAGSSSPSMQPVALKNWAREAVFIGGIGALLGILPIIAANRYIEFERFSHYALPASLAASVLLAAGISLIYSRKIELGVSALVFFLAALSHYAVAAEAVTEERAIQNFWWQVAWRVPHLRENTSLMVNYPSIAYGEDYETVSGPANFIYYNQPSAKKPVIYPISAISMTSEGIKNILARAPNVDKTIRSHMFSIDYENVLVMSQPVTDVCVRVIDPVWREYSVSELEGIILIGPESKIDNVVLDAQSPVPPSFLFGAEPAHGWCFYYQKAALARQQQDWTQVANLGMEAARLGLQPNDPIEWMPFLQAYAMLGDEIQVKQISTRVNTHLLYKLQACWNLQAMEELGPGMRSYVDELFCGRK